MSDIRRLELLTEMVAESRAELARLKTELKTEHAAVQQPSPRPLTTGRPADIPAFSVADIADMSPGQWKSYRTRSLGLDRGLDQFGHEPGILAGMHRRGPRH